MAPKGTPRDKKFTMLLSDKENRALLKLADHEGMSAATWLRRTILERHAAIQGASRLTGALGGGAVDFVLRQQKELGERIELLKGGAAVRALEAARGRKPRKR